MLLPYFLHKKMQIDFIWPITIMLSYGMIVLGTILYWFKIISLIRGFGIWDNNHFCFVSIIYCSPSELMQFVPTLRKSVSDAAESLVNHSATVKRNG